MLNLVSLDLSQIILLSVCGLFALLWRNAEAKNKALEDVRNQQLKGIVDQVNVVAGNLKELANKLEGSYTPVAIHNSLAAQVDQLKLEINKQGQRFDAHIGAINNTILKIKLAHKHIHPNDPIDAAD